MAHYASINRLIACLVTLVSVLPVIGMAQCTPRFVGMTLDQVKAQSKFSIKQEAYGDLNGDGEGDFVLYLQCNADSLHPTSKVILLGLTTEGQQKVVNQYLCGSFGYHSGLGVFSDDGYKREMYMREPGVTAQSYPELNYDYLNTSIVISDVGWHEEDASHYFLAGDDLYQIFYTFHWIWSETGEVTKHISNYLEGYEKTKEISFVYDETKDDYIKKVEEDTEIIEALPQRIIPYDPNHPERGEEYYAYNRDGFLAGDSLMKHHQYEEAVDAYDQQVIQNPWDDEVYLARAKARHMADDFVGRCEDWHMASKLGNSEASRLAGKYCREDTSEETE